MTFVTRFTPLRTAQIMSVDGFFPGPSSGLVKPFKKGSALLWLLSTLFSVVNFISPELVKRVYNNLKALVLNLSISRPSSPFPILSSPPRIPSACPVPLKGV